MHARSFFFCMFFFLVVVFFRFCFSPNGILLCMVSVFTCMDSIPHEYTHKNLFTSISLPLFNYWWEHNIQCAIVCECVCVCVLECVVVWRVILILKKPPLNESLTFCTYMYACMYSICTNLYVYEYLTSN